MKYRLIPSLVLLCVSLGYGTDLTVSTAPVTQVISKIAPRIDAKSDLSKAGIYNMGGKLFIDRNVEVSKGFRADRYLEMVSTAAPLAPTAGYARFYMSNSSNTLCAIYPNGAIGCFGFGGSTSTITTGMINAFDPLYYNSGTGNLTLGTVSLSTGTNALYSTNTWTANQGWTTPAVSTFTYGVAVGSLTVTDPTSITKLGIVTVGNWTGTVVGTQYGGTSANLNAAHTGAVPYFNGNGVMGFSNSPTTFGQLLTSGTTDTGTTPLWISSTTFILSTTTLLQSTTFYVSSGSVSGQFNTGTFQGASLTTCGDASHALGWSAGSFSCQAISTGTAVAGGTSGQIQYNNATALGGVNSYVTSSSVTIMSTFTFLGTQTNDNAPAGYNGEVISSAFSSVSTPSSTVWGDATSIVLTAGDWDISYVIEFYSSTYSAILAGIGTASGTSTTGVAAGNITTLTVSTTDSTLSLGKYRLSIASGATYYLKVNATFSGGSHLMDGGFIARRAR